MANFDQAAGLRRLLSEPRPILMSFLSALDECGKSEMLANLGVALAKTGEQVLLLDARTTHESISAWFAEKPTHSILDVAVRHRKISGAECMVAPGLGVAQLAQYALGRRELSRETARQLASTFEQAVVRKECVLADAALDAHGMLPLAALEEGGIIVQLTPHPDVIKSAYAMIKRMSLCFSRQTFGVLVTQAGAEEAEKIFANMAQAAGKYLGVTLVLAGHVPPDAHFKRALRAGRTVVDAFPEAPASRALMRVAEQIKFAALAYTEQTRHAPRFASFDI